MDLIKDDIIKRSDLNIAKDAGNDTKKALKKIVVGQVIYYVLPPVVFETQMLTRKKGMTLDHFFKEIQLSGKRIIRYAINKLGEMFKRIVGNAVNKFVKTFFDIIIRSVYKELHADHETGAADNK